MASTSDLNTFDKLYNSLSPYRMMEQILDFALLSKIILSYKIDCLNSFYDQLVEGLWTKYPNGYFYKVDDCREKFAYVVVNENFEADVQKSLEKLRSFSVARKVFDETSDQILSLNQNHNECFVDGNGFVCEQNDLHDDIGALYGEYNITKQTGEEPFGASDLVSDVAEVGVLVPPIDSISTKSVQEVFAENMFDELSEPILSSNKVLITQEDDSLMHVSGEFQVCLEGDFEQKIGCGINEGRALNLPRMFNEMRHSDLIKGSIEKIGAPIEEIALDNSVENNYKFSSYIVHKVHDESIGLRQRVFVKLGSVEKSYFWELVTICASQERFFTISSTIYSEHQPRDRISQDGYELCAGIFSPEQH
ncbi:hypothetical protein RND81_08G065100 [Saponaria officinalis]|uniref:Uncharacterized protein n=1 Tax=Saponaria officinalis TaxID=3572 RepID=A0AAW1J4I8_SAPOF